MGLRDRTGSPHLSSRLRLLTDDVGFQVLMGSGTGAVAFSQLAHQLQAIAPLDPDERAAVLHLLERYVDRQLRHGAPQHLRAMTPLLEQLGVEDLPIPADTLAALEPWLTRLTAVDLAELVNVKLIPERNGTLFESAWHHEFIPPYLANGLAFAYRTHARAYLEANNAWAKSNPLSDDEVKLLVDGRETLARLSRGAPRRGGRSFPRTVGLLVQAIDGGKGAAKKPAR